MHDRDDVAEGQRRERCRLKQRQNLRDDEDAPPIRAIDDDAGKRCEQQCRNLAAEGDEARSW